MKVYGTYESVTRGVSQQVPHQRFSGQHTEQVNLLSDPVEGLVRRRGTRLLRELLLLGGSNQAQVDAIQKSFRTYIWNHGLDNNPLQVAYHTQGDATSHSNLMIVSNQGTKQLTPTQYVGPTTLINKALQNGISAVTSVGRYLIMGINNNIGTLTASQDYLATSNRTKVLAWVRGGAYSRTFTVTVLLTSGGSLKFSYTTMANSYPTLPTYPTDTAATDYQERLSKAQADYNAQTVKWLGDASKDVQPETIAFKLLNGPGTGNTGTGTGLIAANTAATGINKITSLRYSLVGATLYIQGDNVTEIVVDDGGDTTLIRGVGNEVTSSDLVSIRHWYGKIVKVRAKKSDDSDAFYLKADNKNSSNDPATGGLTTDSSPAISNTTRGEVIWKEDAGYRQTLSNHFLYGYYHTDNNVYITSDLSVLETLLGITAPKFQPNLCGDDFTNPPPSFHNKQITYLGVFQDRLVVGSGSVLSFSRPGDYLNFFRQSVLSLIDTDPIDMFALGTEDDVIRHSVLFDKSLLVFGDKRQYVVNGRTVLTPINQNITVISQFPNTTSSRPQGSGNYVFYTKPGDTSKPVITLNQLQYGQIADSTDSFDLTQQLTDYCAGRAADIIPVVSPSRVIIRPETGNGLYLFTYTDEVGTGRRLQAAWDRWEFDEAFGKIISIATYGDEVIAMVLRQAGASTYLGIEQLSLRPAKDVEPYFDSYQVATGVGAGITVSSAYWNNLPAVRDRVQVAVIGGTNYLTGATYAARAQLTTAQIDGGSLVCGIPFTSSVTPTNPYQRDNNGTAVLSGRLLLSNVELSVAETAAFDVSVSDPNRTWTTKHFNGWILGRVQSKIGTQPIRDIQINCLVGREVRECSYRIDSVRWLPFNLTAISWTGQAYRR